MITAAEDFYLLNCFLVQVQRRAKIEAKPDQGATVLLETTIPRLKRMGPPVPPFPLPLERRFENIRRRLIHDVTVSNLV